MTAGPQLPPTPSAGTATTAPPAAHGAPPAERVEVLRLPDALLARLVEKARPLILSGTVQQAKPDGTVPLRTQLGEILLNIGKALPAGRQVTLHIPPPTTGNPAVQLAQRGLPAFLLTPTSVGTGAAAPVSAAPGPPASALPTPRVSPAAPAGQVPTANAQPSVGGAPPATGIRPTVGGTPVNLAAQMLGQRTASAPTPTTASPASGVTGQPATGPAPTAAPPVPGMPGQPATAPAGQPGPAVATGPQGASSAPTPTPIGTATLPTGAERQAGPPTSPAAARLPGQPLPAPLSALPHSGPVAADADVGGRMLRGLTETLQVLAQSNDALAGQVLRALVPQPGSGLTASLLLFLFAVRGGDSRGWLGERASATLDAAGRGDLLGRLAVDFAAMGRGEAAAGEARPITIPFLFGGELHGLRFTILPDAEQDDPSGRRRRGGRRFQIDLELSQLGPVQLEGMMHVKRFDLALRTYRQIPREARAEAVRVFEAACQASGLVGALTFQSGPQFWADLVGRGRLGPRANLSA